MAAGPVNTRRTPLRVFEQVVADSIARSDGRRRALLLGEPLSEALDATHIVDDLRVVGDSGSGAKAERGSGLGCDGKAHDHAHEESCCGDRSCGVTGPSGQTSGRDEAALVLWLSTSGGAASGTGADTMQARSAPTHARTSAGSEGVFRLRIPNGTPASSQALRLLIRMSPGCSAAILVGRIAGPPSMFDLLIYAAFSSTESAAAALRGALLLLNNQPPDQRLSRSHCVISNFARPVVSARSGLRPQHRSARRSCKRSPTRRGSTAARSRSTLPTPPRALAPGTRGLTSPGSADSPG